MRRVDEPVAAPYNNPGTEGPSPGLTEDHPWHNHPFRNGDGIIFPNTYLKPRRAATIIDGMSNTMLLGEDVYGRNFHGHNWVHSVCSWRLANCPVNLRDETGQFATHFIDLGFYSRHPGGANFAMADGASRFLSEDTALGIVRALGTLAGGEVVPNP